MYHYILSILLFFSYSLNSFSQCTTEGPNNPNTLLNDNLIGALSWNNLTNIIFSNNNNSSAGFFIGVLFPTTTNFLMSENFGFNIPANANICGIKVDMEREADGLGLFSSIKDDVVKIVKGGVASGNNHALAGNWPSNDTYVSYGSDSDAWGETWTPADINSNNFGFAISAALSPGLAGLGFSAQIDHIQVTVYYDIPLPIKLIKFNIKRSDYPTVLLNWETSSEINNDYFTVERSIDGINWETREKINGAGNSNSALSYSFEDENNLTETSYYRLKQTDFSGYFEYSNTLSVKPVEKLKISIYPNPSQGELNINADEDIIKVEILNLLGKAVYIKNVNKKNTKIDLSQLPQDIYLVKTYTSNSINTKKIVLKTN